MNAVVIAVLVLLILALGRVHIVVALFAGALAGGLAANLGLAGTLSAFQQGLGGGAQIALSYALLGAFAMALAGSGLPKALADWLIRLLGGDDEATASPKAVTVTRYAMIVGVAAMSVMSQNLIPVHIAFIPLLIPALLTVMNRLKLDRRVIASALTFGLVTTYFFIPMGFGKIFMQDLLCDGIEAAGVDVSGVSLMGAMAIPALGMLIGLLIAVFFSYRKPREYADIPATAGTDQPEPEPSTYKIVMSIIAVVAVFTIQIVMNAMTFDVPEGMPEPDGLLIGSLVGLAIFVVSGAVKYRQADNVFTEGMKMMALIGFIMITAHGFASVVEATGHVEPLVVGVAEFFGDSKALATFSMLLVGLIVTMGIGSSFSTLPIITTIYAPLAMSLGLSPMATVSIIGTAGALGDAGSPASDSTLGPTMGLNADGQHDHIRDTVIPTFLHFNIPLLLAGWAAAMIL